jgi:Uma2 family endonuclease
MNTKTAMDRMTAEEFYEWVRRPENADRCFELLRGQVIEVPRPSNPHGRVCINVGLQLEEYAKRRGNEYLRSNDAGVILQRNPDTVRRPDVALYEDAPDSSNSQTGYGEIPPRLAVEVLSPSDNAGRVLSKITDYLTHGVRLVWLVDPEDRSVTVYRPDKSPYELEGDAELTGYCLVFIAASPTSFLASR